MYRSWRVSSVTFNAPTWWLEYVHFLHMCLRKCRDISEWGRGLWKILSRCLWRLSLHQTWNLHDQILGRRRISQRNCNFSLSEILGDLKWWTSEIISESQSTFRGRNFELISQKIGTSGHPRYYITYMCTYCIPNKITWSRGKDIQLLFKVILEHYSYNFSCLQYILFQCCSSLSPLRQQDATSKPLQVCHLSRLKLSHFGVADGPLQLVPGGKSVVWCQKHHPFFQGVANVFFVQKLACQESILKLVLKKKPF